MEASALGMTVWNLVRTRHILEREGLNVIRSVQVVFGIISLVRSGSFRFFDLAFALDCCSSRDESMHVFSLGLCVMYNTTLSLASAAR